LKKSQLTPIALIAALLLLGIWAVFLLWGYHLPATTWARILPGYDLAEAAMGPSPLHRIPIIVGAFLALVTLMVAGLFQVAYFWEDLRKPHVLQRICAWAAAASVFIILVEGMIRYSAPAPWYDVKTMMTDPGSVPVYGQRRFFIWPAVFLKYLVPQLTHIQAFLIVQIFAIAITVYIVGVWSALFVGRELKYIGQLILAVLLFPTFRYYNGHDFGVIIFYTAAFLFLYKRQYWAYAVAVCVGMLNHQNVLLLIPTAFAILWGNEKRSTVLRLVGLTAAAYFIIQFVLNIVMPIPQTHEIKVWWNIREIVELQQGLVIGQLPLLAWYAFGIAALYRAEDFLKRAMVLLPMQYGVYFLFGQLNETRIFNGFIPILIGIFLCHLRGGFAVTVSRVSEGQVKSGIVLTD
jgi:hypothetical protein